MAVGGRKATDRLGLPLPMRCVEGSGPGSLWSCGCAERGAGELAHVQWGCFAGECEIANSFEDTADGRDSGHQAPSVPRGVSSHLHSYAPISSLDLALA